MTLRGKIAVLVAGLTAAILAALGIFLAGSWSGWSRDALERDLVDRAGAIAGLLEVKKRGGIELEHEDSPVLRDPTHPWRLVGPEGWTLSGGDLPWPAPAEGQEVVRDRDGRAWLVVTRLLPPGEDERHGRGQTVRVAVQVAGLHAPHGALEDRFRRGLLVALVFALGLGGGAAALLARISLAPLRRLASEIDAIGASSIERRVGTAGLDPELGRLAGAFNDLLARLEEAMQRQRQLVSRASHALRTPTATILTRAEVALRRERDGGEYREALGEIAAAARESAALVAHLLTLARLDERRKALQCEPVPVGEVAAELVRLLRPRAEEAGIALEVDVPEGLALSADRAALRELLEALLDNALHYTPRGERAGIRASAAPGAVVLSVWDTGPGIPAEERAQVLDRFQRGSAGESSGRPGSGLGLAIVKAIAEAHGAALSLGERPGGGLLVEVRFPAGAEARR